MWFKSTGIIRRKHMESEGSYKWGQLQMVHQEYEWEGGWLPPLQRKTTSVRGSLKCDLLEGYLWLVQGDKSQLLFLLSFPSHFLSMKNLCPSGNIDPPDHFLSLPQNVPTPPSPSHQFLLSNSRMCQPFTICCSGLAFAHLESMMHCHNTSFNSSKSFY